MVRKESTLRLQHLLSSKKSEFVAVMGRRRVGKTYLIDTVFKDHICFRITGIQQAGMSQQLLNFSTKLAEYSQVPMFKPLTDWQEAFLYLRSYLSTLDASGKRVIFIDELPWIATPKSGFLQLLGHLWNDYLSKEKHFILVVCGSATSWIAKNVTNDKGGLHNRLTESMVLKPLTLPETHLFLEESGIKLVPQELAKIYMVTGGIPYYLENLRRGESAMQAIERMCFTESGILRNEFDNLFKALFRNAKDYEVVIAALSMSNQGLTREEILLKTKIKDGGPYRRVMDDLLISGFIAEDQPFGKKKRGSTYRLTDEYCAFYWRFIKPNQQLIPGVWTQISQSQNYKIWLGFAFESLCYKHLESLKKVLGISGVYTEVSRLNVKPENQQDGFQIDLIVDRKDQVINLVEIKHYEGPFTISKEYYHRLLTRKQQFLTYSGTRKQVFLTFVTNHSMKENEYSQAIVDSHFSLEELFGF